MGFTYVFLLLVNMTDLEPDVFLCQRARWVLDDIFEALGWSQLTAVSSLLHCVSYLQALTILLLLFVYNTQPKVDLVRFFEVWLHMHHL